MCHFEVHYILTHEGIHTVSFLVDHHLDGALVIHKQPLSRAPPVAGGGSRRLVCAIFQGSIAARSGDHVQTEGRQSTLPGSTLCSSTLPSAPPCCERAQTEGCWTGS